MSRSEWQVDIGLEIHVQLLTNSKIFSGASTQFGAKPNTQACSIDLGLPGVLPVVNEMVYEKAVTFGLGIGAKINTRSVFDRKNYFYPDSPKGYQITQLSHPIVEGGQIEIVLSNNQTKLINVTRAHLEEDAGKSVHDEFQEHTGIDLNRAGTPLLEIVSEPEMKSSEEAVAYAKYMHQLVTYLMVSDGNMSQGSLRCDANVSVRKLGDDVLGVRTETKNLNSFRFLERAIEFEIDRQIRAREAGETIKQETLLYDSILNETRPMRSKETATDYRYFPEPDLLPVEISEEYIDAIRKKMPELSHQKVIRFMKDYQLNEEDAKALTVNTILSKYFEDVALLSQDPKVSANWIRVEVMARLNKDNLDSTSIPVLATETGYLIARIKDGSISGKIAKSVFDALWQGESSAKNYIEQNDLIQVSNSSELAPLIDAIIANNPKQVEQFRSGKRKLMGFFVGQVMQETRGKANPQQVNELLQAKLS